MSDIAEIIGVQVSVDDQKRYRLVKQHGACKDLPPGFMFPTDGAGVSRATKFCANSGCQVRGMCLELALTYNEFGVWGGTGERERRRILKSRKVAAA